MTGNKMTIDAFDGSSVGASSVEASSLVSSSGDGADLVLPLTAERLRALFTRPWGGPGPSREEWRQLYADGVRFSDPTQSAAGIDAFLAAQEGLVKRCDDVLLDAHAVALDQSTAFVEWTMVLKIKGLLFTYPGSSRLILDGDGKIVDHRDYFDFMLPTFTPVPVLGPFLRWLYGRFVA